MGTLWAKVHAAGMGNRFTDLLRQSRKEYKSWKSMYVPALGEWIEFNSQGFNHLRFHVRNERRKPQEVIHKLGLLPEVRKVLKDVIEIERHEVRRAPVGGSRKPIIRKIEYWSFVASLQESRAPIRVVVRRIGKGKIHFWSVMRLPGERKIPT